MRSQARSPAARSWQHLYWSRRWLLRRAAQLDRVPNCEWCARHGRVTPATIPHHNEPHRGDPVKFHEGALTSLCKACHDGPAQSIERLGYSREIGLDGYPIDARHPINTGELPGGRRR